jgi:nicotinamidase/pyrazinamidase
VVDVQRDFCPGGAPPIAHGDEIVPLLNAWIEHALRSGALVAASCDRHPPDHVSFISRGGPWPEHCVQGTEGSKLHPSLRLPDATLRLSKGRRGRPTRSA